MNKEKALKVIELARNVIKIQKELSELGVTFQVSQSLSDATSFCQGYLVAITGDIKEEPVETVKE